MSRYRENSRVFLGRLMNEVAIDIETHSKNVDDLNITVYAKVDKTFINLLDRVKALRTFNITVAYVKSGEIGDLLKEYLEILEVLEKTLKKMEQEQKIFSKIPEHEALVERIDSFIEKTGYFD